MLLEQRGHARPVVVRRHEHAADAHDRLADERRDLVRADARDGLLELVDEEVGRVLTVVEVAAVGPRRRDVRDVGQHRAETVVVDVEARGGAAAVRDAVIAVAPRDDPVAALSTEAVVVVPRHLERGLVALGAAAGEVDVVDVVGRDARELGRERDRLVVGELPERREVLERRDLLGGDLRELLASVPDLREPEATGRVEVLLAVHVGERGVLAAGHDHPLLVRGRQVRVDDVRPVGLLQGRCVEVDRDAGDGGAHEFSSWWVTLS